MDKLVTAQRMRFGIERVFNIAGKGENAGYHHFLLFLPCFEKLSYSRSLKWGGGGGKETEMTLFLRTIVFNLSRYDKVLHQSKFKTCAEDQANVTMELKLLMEIMGNIFCR